MKCVNPYIIEMITAIIETFDKLVLTKKSKVTATRKKNWMNNNIKCSLKLQNRLHNQWLQLPMSRKNKMR